MEDLSYLIPLRNEITKRPHLAELASVVVCSEHYTATPASDLLVRRGPERWNLSASAWEVVLSGPSGAFDVSNQAACAASSCGAPEAQARRMFYLVVLELLAKMEGVSASLKENMLVLHGLLEPFLCDGDWAFFDALSAARAELVRRAIESGQATRIEEQPTT